MPPVSQAQRRAMWAARNDPAVAKRMGIPEGVAKEFTEADPGGKLPERKGKVPYSKPRESK